ncbi:hypothetical protein IFM89_036791 [Coptis chinensis]|uniref:Uncharacterized protein n=1 Tax=Coptis chinensis TaxID=261450 RepID=A0A835LPR3_9MAGN|nr:hypothetical protein IFM89_036791 [Coptis chinensis]
MKSCPSSSEQSNRKEAVRQQQTFLTTAGQKFPNALQLSTWKCVATLLVVIYVKIKTRLRLVEQADTWSLHKQDLVFGIALFQQFIFALGIFGGETMENCSGD